MPIWVRNVVGALLTVVGVAGTVWGASGSVRAAVGVAGVVLAGLAVLLLIDLDEES